jgi:rhomboid protease GluP
VSWLLSLPLLKVHNSYLLLRVGALNADLLSAGQWWRLITSQFLHVHIAHLVFNMAALLLLGAALERHIGSVRFILLFAIGGSIGQLAGVASAPALVSSGASQAVMAVAGARAVGLLSGRAGGLAPAIILLAVVGVQLGLDVLVAGTFKAGHWSSLCAGAAIGYLLSRQPG